MKTSNIILITITSSITLIIVSFFMELRFYGVKKKSYNKVVYSTVVLSEFKYLVIKESLNVTITTSDRVEMLIYAGASGEKPQVTYDERGDTLYIGPTNNGGNTMSVTLTAPVEHIKWIRAENTYFSLADFTATNLRVHLDHSTLRINTQNHVKFGTLKIAGVKDSHIYSNGIEIDTLRLNLDQTQARIVGRIHKLKGSMINHSSLFAKDVSDIEFRKDSTSRMY